MSVTREQAVDVMLELQTVYGKEIPAKAADAWLKALTSKPKHEVLRIAIDAILNERFSMPTIADVNKAYWEAAQRFQDDTEKNLRAAWEAEMVTRERAIPYSTWKDQQSNGGQAR